MAKKIPSPGLLIYQIFRPEHRENIYRKVQSLTIPKGVDYHYGFYQKKADVLRDWQKTAKFSKRVESSKYFDSNQIKQDALKVYKEFYFSVLFLYGDEYINQGPLEDLARSLPSYQAASHPALNYLSFKTKFRVFCANRKKLQKLNPTKHVAYNPNRRLYSVNTTLCSKRLEIFDGYAGYTSFCPTLTIFQESIIDA